MGVWREYWDKAEPAKPSLRREAQLYCERLRSLRLIKPEHLVLDVGCGWGLPAAELSKEVRAVDAWDASATMRRHASEELAGHANAAVLEGDSLPLHAAADSYNVILMNSVVQYMTERTLRTTLSECTRVLAPGGVIIVSDLIPPQLSLGREALSTALRRPGLLLDRVVGFWPRYVRAKQAGTFLRISEEYLARVAHACGLEVHRLENNLTHLAQRWSAVLREANPE